MTPEERERLKRKEQDIIALMVHPGTPPEEVDAAREALDRVRLRLQGLPPREPLPDGFELLVYYEER
jgi:hypothetical protein